MIFQLDIYFKVSFRKASILLSTLYKKTTQITLAQTQLKSYHLCVHQFSLKEWEEREREREREREIRFPI